MHVTQIMMPVSLRTAASPHPARLQKASGYEILNELAIQFELVACLVNTMKSAHARHVIREKG